MTWPHGSRRVSPEAVAAAAAALAQGELVALPTESTYGLAADLRRPDALVRLVALKGGRAPDSPFPVIAADRAAARALARVWPAAAEALAVRHWPGPLTLVVPARPGLPIEVVGPAGRVGVRVSSHPVAAALTLALAAPITATSANRSGAPAATSATEALAALGDAVAVYLDGGRCEGAPSTVVAVAESGRLELLRRGPVEL